MNVGHVYVVHTTLTKPDPKDKITLCLCLDPHLFFWINTKAKSDGDGQLGLSQVDHPEALTRECFLDCSRVTTFRQTELDEARHRGAISQALAARIVTFLTATPPKGLTGKQVKMAIAAMNTIATPVSPMAD